MESTMLELRDSRSWTEQGWSQRVQQGQSRKATLEPMGFLGPALLRPTEPMDRKQPVCATGQMKHLSVDSAITLHILQKLLSCPPFGFCLNRFFLVRGKGQVALFNQAPCALTAVWLI